MPTISRRDALTYVLASSVDTRKLGAKADGIADDTIALQRAINQTPSGGTLILHGRYAISAPIIIDKPITIAGLGQGFPVYTYDDDFTVRMTQAGQSAFILRANDHNFPFFPGHHGVFGICFRDLKIVGPNKTNRTGSGIQIDTSLYGGDLHVRGLLFENIGIRYFDTAIDTVGIAYLNNYYSVRLMACNTGLRASRGHASDSGGQTRLYSCEIIGTKVCIEWDYAGGTLSLFGCTLSESEFGLKAHSSAGLAIFGCEFESLRGDSKSAGIYLNIKNPDNPNSDSSRTIIGNKFLSSTHDIYIEKTSRASAGGGVRYPMLIDGNSFGSPIALRADPTLDQPGLVFGASNTGPNGLISEGQLVDFKGTNMMQTLRHVHAIQRQSDVLQLTGSGAKSAKLHWFELEPKKVLNFQQIERYAVDMETGERGAIICQILLGDKVVADISGMGITSASVTNDTDKMQNYSLVARDQQKGRTYLVILKFQIIDG